MAPGSFPKPKEDNYYEFNSFRVPKNRIEFRRAGKLSDVPGYVWYTPAILYIWGRYSDVNLSDIVRNLDAKFFWYRFDRPVFAGLTANGDAAWNHILWAAREDQWLAIVDAILETVQFDIPNKLLFQYAMQSVSIVDPLCVDRQATVTMATPVIQIKTFAVLSNTRQIAFDNRGKFVRGRLPQVVSFKPSELHSKVGRRLFRREGLTQDKAFSIYKGLIREKPKLERSDRQRRTT